jgi:hypothetical protein
MPNKNYDYLKWDAVGTKEAIKQKLAENPIFTDYIFEDSNLTTLIDVFAHTFDVLTYYLNHGASEAIFSDANLYENINRMAKILNYNPSGHSSPKLEAIFATVGQLAGDDGTFADNSQKILPKYTYVNTNKIDVQGRNIYYSLVNSRFLNPDSSGILSDTNSDATSTFVNGRWTLYPDTYASDGSAFQSFALTSLNVGGTSDEVDYVSHPYIDVYVKNKNNVFLKYTPLSSGTLFNVNSTLVNPNDRVYELRLDENLNYTITFGDGIHGTRLSGTDEVYVVYLKGNGSESELPVDFFDVTNTLDYGIAGMDDNLFNDIVDGTGVDHDNLMTASELSKLYIKNTSASTSYASYESAEEIRSSAPAFFRQGDRLINAQDYKTYVKSTFRNDVYDVGVMNNYEYLATFLNWLRENNSLSADVREANYLYADTCDFNNIYLWIKYKGKAINPNLIESELYRRKAMTTEPIIVEALPHIIAPAIVNNGYSIEDWDPCVENWIELEKDPNSVISADRIKQRGIDVFEKFFSSDALNIGEAIDISTLQTQLESIDGVKSVKTVFLSKEDSDNGDCHKRQVYLGLKMFSWTKQYINGVDIDSFSGVKPINSFQYPQILDTDALQLNKRIKVSFSTIGGQLIEY